MKILFGASLFLACLYLAAACSDEQPELLDAGASEDTGAPKKDTGAPKKDSSAGHDLSGAKQCSSGVCCDGITGLYKPSTTVCKSFPPEYKCVSPGACGSGRQYRMPKQVCSGMDSACNGKVASSAWTSTSSCSSKQRCKAGKCAHDASCP